jgi:hypothetical protein
MFLRRVHGQSRRIRHMLAIGSTLPKQLFRLPASAVLFLAGHCAVASGVLSEAVLLDVHKDARLLFTEEISKGSKVERLGQGKQGAALVHYEGEIFSLPGSLLLPAAAPPPTEAAAAGSVANTNDLPEAGAADVRWSIGSKELRNPRIIKEFPLSVMVRHEDGVDFIARKDIPQTLPDQVAAQQQEAVGNGPARARADAPKTTSWLRLRKFMEMKSSGGTVDTPQWSVEREIARKEQENKDLTEILNYSYMGLTDLVHENSAASGAELPEVLSLEEEFTDKGIVARQQRKRECGVEALSVALEYLLRAGGLETKIVSSDVANLVRRYPDARGSVGFALSMGPEIISKHGIPTSSGRVRKGIRVRGIYKFFMANRDEFPDEKINSNPLGFQQSAIAKFIRNELANKRPILAGTWTGHADKRGDTIGPGFEKHNYPHAVLIVGMSKTDDPAHPVRYRILNSWGREWGENGYGWLYPSKIEKLYSLELL